MLVLEQHVNALLCLESFVIDWLLEPEGRKGPQKIYRVNLKCVELDNKDSYIRRKEIKFCKNTEVFLYIVIISILNFKKNEMTNYVRN